MIRIDGEFENIGVRCKLYVEFKDGTNILEDNIVISNIIGSEDYIKYEYNHILEGGPLHKRTTMLLLRRTIEKIDVIKGEDIGR